MCREPEQIEQIEQINLAEFAAEKFRGFEVTESDDGTSPDQSDAEILKDLRDPPILIVLNHAEDSQPVVETQLPSSEMRPNFLHLPRLLFTLLIGFMVFSIEWYLFDFPEFQSEIDGNTQILGGLTTAVGGFALLSKTNSICK